MMVGCHAAAVLLLSGASGLLTHLKNPDFAVFLLVAGILLVYLEFNVPGTVIPGALGLLAILFALFGLSSLPLRHTSIGCIFIAIAFILMEIKFSLRGILAAIGTSTLIFGLSHLVNGPPELRVHLSTAIASSLTFSIVTISLARVGLKARLNKTVNSSDALLGLVAIARSPLHPANSASGQVEVRGELWQAILAPDSPPANVEQQTVILAVNGLTLIVRALPPKV